MVNIIDGTPSSGSKPLALHYLLGQRSMCVVALGIGPDGRMKRLPRWKAG